MIVSCVSCVACCCLVFVAVASVFVARFCLLLRCVLSVACCLMLVVVCLLS